MATAVARDTNGSESAHRGTVKRRLKWSDLTPFPGNAIFLGRLDQMEKEWGGYRHELVGSPAVFDNSAGAFPDLPEDALLIGDGNHRRELAMRHGEEEAEVLADLHRGLDRAQMHHRRRGLNDRRTIKPAERFIELAQENRHGPERHLLNEVEALGWKIGYERGPETLSCVQQLMWIRQRSKAALTLALQTYEKAWGSRADNAQAMVIKGLGAFWIKYPNADAESVSRALNTSDPGPLYQAGRNQKDVLPFIKTVHDGIRYVIAQNYNRNRRAGRLPL
jgi:hypothetical protein